MTHCAREGFSIIPFDISNAFVRASMGEIKVAITLPESFRDGHDDNGRRMLKKALYGLPISPRLWAKTLAKDLASLGWTECKSEPGVYIKSENGVIVGYLTVYVDDCILAGCNLDRVNAELALINAKHPLSVIETKTDDNGTQFFDMCGADIEYNAEKNTLRISMSNYIRKILKRFDMQDVKERTIPGFPEKNLYNKDAKSSTFKYKAAVGALSWLATTARPDIAHSVNMLARAGAEPINTAMHKCCKLVFRYLKFSIDLGIEYSREKEAEFEEIYRRVATQHDNNVGKSGAEESVKEPVHLFTDASFGVEYKTLRSITGVVVYLHGTPIAWKTKVQTIHTSSTTESEWVALADGIEFSASTSALHNFLVGRPEMSGATGPIWCDNQAAVRCARKGPEGVEEIPKKTRHVALRFARVLSESKRLWFVPTDLQKSDGLTKSNNPNALLQVFRDGAPYISRNEDEDIDETDLDLYEAWFTMINESNKNGWHNTRGTHVNEHTTMVANVVTLWVTESF
jgi:hypothetical protein